MRRAAAFLWMTPLESAVERAFSAPDSEARAAAASPRERASRTFFTALFTAVRVWTFLARRFWA